jgi:hypothetical protein
MRSQEDIQLIKVMQSSIESLQVDFDAVVKKYDEARAEVEQWRSAYNHLSNLCSDKVERVTKDHDKARAEFNRLTKERDEARAEVEQLKQALHDARLENSGQAALLERKRPEPLRLEIAAMTLAARSTSTFYQDPSSEARNALAAADALIAAAKEGK